MCLPNSQRFLSIIYHLLSVVCCLLLSGCATIQTQAVTSSKVMPINDFCKKYAMQYSFDTIDDIVKIYREDKEARLILNSSTVYFNGAIFELSRPPIYAKGSIYLPHELGGIITSHDEKFLKPSFSIKTIVIDPGHGGKDPGAISRRGLKEKGLNLSVAKYLEEELKRRGFHVVLTRSTDKFLTLQERVNVAKICNADLFVSVHTNANRSKAINGSEIYYLSPTRLNSLERAVNLSKKDYFSSKNLTRDSEIILWDLLLMRNYSLSVELANTLFRSFKNMGLKTAYPKKAPYYVLRLAYVSAVLVEMGYLTNPYEEKMLRRRAYQKQLAEAIASGIASLNNRYAYLAEGKHE